MPSTTINLTRLDYFIGQSRMQLRHPVNIAGWLLLGAWMTFSTFRGMTHPTLVAAVLAFLLSMAACAIVLVLIGVVVVFAMTLMARTEHGTLGEHVYRFSDAGLIESTRVNENLIKWGGARAVLRTRGALYIRVTYGLYHTIPRRYFADAAADEAFWNALQPLVGKKVS